MLLLGNVNEVFMQRFLQRVLVQRFTLLDALVWITYEHRLKFVNAKLRQLQGTETHLTILYL